MDLPSHLKKCRFLTAGLFLPSLILWQGCSTAHYKKRADKAAYRVVSQAEQAVFGESSDFTIATEHTDRSAEEFQIEEIFDDRSEKELLRIDLEEAVDLARRNNRQYQTEKERLYLTALSLTDQRHTFRPQPSARLAGSRNVSADGIETESAGADLGIGMFLATGANFSLNLASDIFRYVTNPTDETISSVLSFSIFQPLLRGAGWKIAAERLTQSQRNVIYAVRNFANYQNEFKVAIVLEYFRLLQRQDTVYNEYKNYQSRIISTEYLKARSVDRAKALEVNRAEQSQLSARNRYISSIVGYRNSLDRFKILLGLPQTVDLRLDNSEMDALKSKGLMPHGLDAKLCFDLALNHRLPLLNEIDQFEDVKRRTKLAANGLKMELGISANASVDSLDNNDYANFDFDRIRRSIGVSVDLPINNLSERNDYRATLIQFETAIRSFSLTLDQLRSQVEASYQELERLKQNYEIQKIAVNLAEKNVLGAQLSIEAGEGIFRDLEDAQDNLISAQNAQTGALVDYLEERLYLLNFIGIIETNTDFFWLTDASTVDLSTYASTPSTSTTIRSDGSVITPDELFAQ